MEETKRVAILGKGPGWEFAPDHGEVWGINDVFVQHYVSKVFEMHDFTWDLDRCLEHQKRYVGHYYTDEQLQKNASVKEKIWNRTKRLINKHKLEFISVREYEDIPTSKAYPLDEVIEYFGIDYFTCGISYMVALALYEGYKQIDLFGCSMESGSEWDYQRACVSFWLGMAYGMGVTITNTGTNRRLLAVPGGYLYGYDRMQEFYGMVADTFRWIPKEHFEKGILEKVGKENPLLNEEGQDDISLSWKEQGEEIPHVQDNGKS